ncbi:MAG: hypothetical protein J3K34DRAFT_84741 [Monoraphidium minutum]|nr:MAG: hypothetical protein J3K34DRAFT_84741 [Monoraphidium minutum]
MASIGHCVRCRAGHTPTARAQRLGAPLPLRDALASRTSASRSCGGGSGSGSSSVCSSINYDHPALYSSEDAFSERSYWDARFQGEPLGHEWYRDYNSLRPVLTRHLPRGGRLLHLGVGTSTLHADMAARDGYAAIHSIDYSRVAIARQEAARATLAPAVAAALSYGVADMTDLGGAGLGEGAFGGALDKGGLDALLCGDDGEAQAARAVAEVWRVLAPGAAYVMITSASPRARLPVLASGPAPVAWSSVSVYEVGQRGALAGPYEADLSAVAADGGPEVAALPAMGYSHLAYVCVK